MSRFLFISFLLLSVLSKGQDIPLADEYFAKGEYEKALSYYQKIEKNTVEIPVIYANYLQTMLYLQAFDDASKFCKKAIKNNPNNYSYKVDLGNIELKKGDKEKAFKLFDELILNLPSTTFYVQQVAKQFEKYNLNDYAEKTYLKSRENLNNNQLFFFDLSNLYYKNNQKEKLTSHLLLGLEANLIGLNYIQNTLQRIYDEKDYEKLEVELLSKIQNNNQVERYTEFLIWLYYQQKDFESAFFQAKAYDRKQKNEGKTIVEVAELSMKNKQYDLATQAFQYIIDNYSNGQYYLEARQKIIHTKEELVKNNFPIDTLQIRTLINDYQKVINEFGLNYTNATILKRMAELHAFYLDEKEEAIQLLEKLTAIPNVKNELKAEAKLVLGDIYILKNEPWEAILIYAQVDKENKFTTIAHQAKYKQATLSYYIGEFDLAKDHLGILKEATTKEIANNAIELSVFIQDNSGLDTSYTALAEYSKIQLLTFQNKYSEAIAKLNLMLLKFPQHSLTDEIYWLKAEIYLKQGDFDLAIKNLNLIVENYSEDIWADDAVFFIAQIYENNLKNKEEAKNYYKKILLEYSGSIFVNEARQKYRSLRGDF